MRSDVSGCSSVAVNVSQTLSNFLVRKRVNSRAQNVAGIDAFLEVASLLRRQQEEAAALAQSLAQQQVSSNDGQSCRQMRPPS